MPLPDKNEIIKAREGIGLIKDLMGAFGKTDNNPGMEIYEPMLVKQNDQLITQNAEIIRLLKKLCNVFIKNKKDKEQ